MGGMMKKQVGGPATKPVAKGTPNTNRYVQSTPGGGYNEISARQYATTPQNQRAGMQELNQSQYDANKSRISPMKAKKGGAVAKPLAKKQKGGMSTLDKLNIRKHASIIKGQFDPFGIASKRTTPYTANEQNVLMNDKNIIKNEKNREKVAANKKKVAENKQKVKVNAIKAKYKMK
jgi:uncharacterized membrane protein